MSANFGDQRFFSILRYVSINVYWFTLCVLLLTVQFSTNSQEVFEVAATDNISGIAAMRHVLPDLLTTSLASSEQRHTLIEFYVPDPLLFPQSSHKWDS